MAGRSVPAGELRWLAWHGSSAACVLGSGPAWTCQGLILQQRRTAVTTQSTPLLR